MPSLNASMRKLWIVVAVMIGLAAGFAGAFGASLQVFMKPLSEAFGWGRSVMAGCFVTGIAGLALGSPLIGRMTDRFGVVRVALYSGIGFSLGLALLGVQSGHLAYLYGVSFLIGIAGSGTALAFVAVLPKWFDDRLGLALGIATSGLGMGVMLLPPLSQALLDRFGWRAAYVGLGGACLGAGLVAVWLIARQGQSPLRAAIQGLAPAEGMTRGQAVQCRPFWLFFIAHLLLSIGGLGILVHMVPLYSDRGFPLAFAYQVPLAAGAAVTVGRLVVGVTVDRVYAPGVAALLFALCGAGLFGFTMVDPAQPVLSLLPAFLVGLSIGADGDIIAFLTRRYFGEREYASIYGMLQAPVNIGAMIGPMALGYCFDSRGSYAPLLPTLAAACVAAAVLTASVGPYRYHRRGQVEPRGATSWSESSGESQATEF